MLVPSLPSRNKFLTIAVKNYTEADSKFPSPAQFCLIPYLFPNILSRIVDVYYSWEELVNMDASFKTVIISVVCKKGDYI